MSTIEKATVVVRENPDINFSHPELLSQAFDALLEQQNNPQFDNLKQEYSQKLEAFWQEKMREKGLEPLFRANLDNISIVYPQRTQLNKLQNGNKKIIIETLSENTFTEITPNNKLVSIISEIKPKPDTREQNRTSYCFRFDQNGIIDYAERKIIETNQATTHPQLKGIEQIFVNKS